MNTYTIKLGNQYYALGMDLFCENVYQLEAPNHIASIRDGVRGRNIAIQTVCNGYQSFRDALNMAKRGGNYIGMLYPNG